MERENEIEFQAMEQHKQEVEHKKHGIFDELWDYLILHFDRSFPSLPLNFS